MRRNHLFAEEAFRLRRDILTKQPIYKTAIFQIY